MLKSGKQNLMLSFEMFESAYELLVMEPLEGEIHPPNISSEKMLIMARIFPNNSMIGRNRHF